ncbi:glycine zipper 2TM domain-containing protein [Sandarakinorhabdus sp.]|uniref:glycine zipper 2TM domain-containing protein n=1 Tax=Sandarakinorhabdus sp. TaxID=1916663 RepID=UPI00286DA359|nr:glycine zipper 2TM domain-containing protein [Sandarakinorhabdus sp.]
MKMALAALATLALVSGCASDMSDQRPQRQWRSYDYNRPDPQYGNYDPGRYYQDSPRYRERRLGANDRVYRGQDGRYYCRRTDGSTGLIVGAVAGGVLGNIIAPGGSDTLGTILGAVAGGVVGRSIDRKNVRCR